MAKTKGNLQKMSGRVGNLVFKQYACWILSGLVTSEIALHFVSATFPSAV
jgi:hypothetical protein